MSWIDESTLWAASATISRALSVSPLRSMAATESETRLKIETEQPTGSFKVRGALVRIAALSAEEQKRGVVAASAGNHGAGVAFAASKLGIRAEVYVPDGTPAVKCERITELGASLRRVAGGYDAAERAAKSRAAEPNAPVFISPFDDPWVAAGNGGTLALELHDQWPELETVLCPVGGGGLMSGILEASRILGLGWEVIGVQSDACPAMHQSLLLGAPIVEMHAQSTLAEGLEGGVTASTFDVLRGAKARVELVTEAEIADAMLAAEADYGLTLEGSAATVLAWYLSAAGAAFCVEKKVALVISGGNVDAAQLQALRAARSETKQRGPRT